jgi:ATP-dependent RNA helicase DBP3
VLSIRKISVGIVFGTTPHTLSLLLFVNLVIIPRFNRSNRTNMSGLQTEATPDRKSKKREREATQENATSQPVDERDAKRLRKEEKKARKAARLQKKLKKAEKTAAKEQLIAEHKKEQPSRSEIETQSSDSDSNPTSKISTGSSLAQSTAQSSATSLEPSDEETLTPSQPKAKLSTSKGGSKGDKYLLEKDIKIVDPLNQSEKYGPITSFDLLPSWRNLYSETFKSFTEPTPIQAATWPLLFEKRDVIGVAETGSGKTLAFGLPCLERIRALPEKERRRVRAVIVSPTRELACQIHEQLEKLAQPIGLRVVCIYGGVPKDQQRIDLKRAQIVVATPGRLNDLISENAADISHADFLCLDEADRMLDKGFEEDVKKIITSTAPATSRQTVMFTATWPPSVRDLANTFMKTPVQIYIGNTPTGDLKANTRIEQIVEVMDPRNKEMRLHQLLLQYQKGSKSKDRILVFCLYKKEAARIENFVRSKGLRVVGIHGDLTQVKRTASLQAFKSGTVPIMVATDVAARGLDIPAVKLVINVTFPLTAEDYVHRIGRYVDCPCRNSGTNDYQNWESWRYRKIYYIFHGA